MNLRFVSLFLFLALFYGCILTKESATPAPDTFEPELSLSQNSTTQPGPPAPPSAIVNQSPICTFPDQNLNYLVPAQRSGDRRLLVIIADLNSETDPTPSVADVRRAFFGLPPSVSDYYVNNSGGKMRLIDAGIYSYPIDEPISTYFQNDPDDLDHDGWTDDVKKLWTEMVRKADRDMDFSAYDSNHDGYVYPEELGIFILVPHNTQAPGGATRNFESRQYPYPTPLVLDGVTLVSGSSSGSGNPLNIGTPSHELLHLYLGTADLYFSYFFPYAAGAYSIMDQSWFAPHLDPYQKIRAGWLRPKKIISSGCYKIERVDYSNSVNVLEKKVPGGSEFYLFENRQRGTYDAALPDSGLGIWRIIEASDGYRLIQKPDLVRDEDWASVAPDDQGRRGLWMYRPSYYPFDDSKALWSDEDLQNGAITFNWSDGSPAFTLISVSNSKDVMDFQIEIPKK